MTFLYDLCHKICRKLGIHTFGEELTRRIRSLEARVEEINQKSANQDREIAMQKRRADRIELTVRSLKAQIDASTGQQRGARSGDAASG